MVDLVDSSRYLSHLSFHSKSVESSDTSVSSSSQSILIPPSTCQSPPQFPSSSASTAKAPEPHTSTPGLTHAQISLIAYDAELTLGCSNQRLKALLANPFLRKLMLEVPPQRLNVLQSTRADFADTFLFPKLSRMLASAKDVVLILDCASLTQPNQQLSQMCVMVQIPSHASPLLLGILPVDVPLSGMLDHFSNCGAPPDRCWSTTTSALLTLLDRFKLKLSQLIAVCGDDPLLPRLIANELGLPYHANLSLQLDNLLRKCVNLIPHLPLLLHRISTNLNDDSKHQLQQRGILVERLDVQHLDRFAQSFIAIDHLLSRDEQNRLIFDVVIEVLHLNEFLDRSKHDALTILTSVLVFLLRPIADALCHLRYSARSDASSWLELHQKVVSSAERVCEEEIPSPTSHAVVDDFDAVDFEVQDVIEPLSHDHARALMDTEPIVDFRPSVPNERALLINLHRCLTDLRGMAMVCSEYRCLLSPSCGKVFDAKAK